MMKLATSHKVERKDFNAWEFETTAGTVYKVKPAPVGMEPNWEVKRDSGRYYFHTKKEAKEQLQLIDEKMRYWKYQGIEE